MYEPPLQSYRPNTSKQALLISRHIFRSSVKLSLLSLPQKILDQILSAIIPNLTVHITYQQKGSGYNFVDRFGHGLNHVVCNGGHDHFFLKERSKEEEGATLGNTEKVTSFSCHCSCLYQSSTGDDLTRFHPKSLLLTCKNFHTTTTRLLYSTNTFCFTRLSNAFTVTDSVLKFCTSLSTSQYSSIRKLHLQPVLISSPDLDKRALSDLEVEEDWKPLFENLHAPSLRRLTGLQELSLEFVRYWDAIEFCDLAEGHWEVMFMPLTAAMEGVKDLGLKRLDVFIRTKRGYFPRSKWGTDRTPWDDELEERVKAWLLHGWEPLMIDEKVN